MAGEASVETRASDLSRTFALLGDETRCAIVLALADRSTDQWSQEGVRFSELRDAVDVSDGGRFNYHLDRLRGRLVERSGDAYHLTGEGYAIAQLMRSSHVEGDASTSGTTGSCPDCESAVRTRFEEGFVVVECPDHGVLFDMYMPLSVGGAHDLDAIESYAGMRAQWYVELAMRGACAECWGPVTRRAPVELAETPLDVSDATGEELTVEFACRRCNTTYWLPPGVCVLRHPAVVAFYYEERNRNVLSGTYHDLAVYDWRYPHVEESDRGVAVRFVGENEDLRIRLDETATVVEAERVEDARTRGERRVADALSSAGDRSDPGER